MKARTNIILTNGLKYGVIAHEEMEQNRQQVQPITQPQNMPPAQQPGRNNVGFPEQKPDKKGGSRKVLRWIIALIIVALIIVGGIWFVTNNPFGGEGDSEASPTPTSLSSFATPQPTATPTPSPTPEPKEKSEVTIEILNGTGTPGEASYLQGVLEDLGFENIEVANADDQNETRTTFSFDRDLSDEYVSEITGELEDIYEEVRVRRTTLEDYDISILTGPRSGATETSDDTTSDASPSPTASASPTASPSE